MNTMLEYITYIKGIEYIMAITFLIAFVAFWQIIYGSRKRFILKIAVLSYLVLGMVILIVSCLTAVPQ